MITFSPREAFTDLTDVPHSYTGEGGKVAAVTVAEDGLEFIVTGGTGTVTSVTATAPVVITPDPTTTTGDISLDATTADIPDSTDKRYITDSIEGVLTTAGEGTLVGREEGSGDGEVVQIDIGATLLMSGSELNVDPSGFVGGADGQLQYNDNGVFEGFAGSFTDGSNLFLDGPIISGDGATGVMAREYGSASNILFQTTVNNSPTAFLLVPNHAPGTFGVSFALFETDYVADSSNLSFMQLVTNDGGYHEINSQKFGSATLRPISLSCGPANLTHFVIGTDGGVQIGTASAAGSTNLLVAGTITGSNLSGTNTGNQSSIVGISGSIAEFNTACSDADFATGGGTATGTNTGDQTLVGLGGVPTSRTLTINGDAKDLSADRSWTVPASVDTAADYAWTGDHTFASEASIAQTPNGDFTIADGFSMIVPSLYNLPTSTALTINGTGILMVA